MLEPEAAQVVAMVLHELSTNAAKYGAFTNPSGRVSLRWWWIEHGADRGLAIEWQERGGPPVLSPDRCGYGTSLVRELVPFELGGVVDLKFNFSGVQCRIEIPGRWVSGVASSNDPAHSYLGRLA